MAMTVIMVLSLILAALAAISLVKDFLVYFNVSDNGWKTSLAAVLIAVCFFSVLLSYTGAYSVKGIYISLSMTQDTTVEASLKNQLQTMIVMAVTSIGIGYGAYLLYLQQIKRFKENRMKQLELNKDQRWLGKI